MMRKRLFLLALISMVGLSACNKENKPVEAIESTKDCQIAMKSAWETVEVLPVITDEAWVDANNQFGLNLLRHVPIDESVIASPFSIERALGMTLDGAAGNTAKEMRVALALPEASGLSAAGARVEEQILDVFEDNETASIRLVNQLWIEKAYSLRSEFLLNAKRDYDAKPTLLDFVGDPDASRVIINAKIAEQTDGEIQDLISEDVIDSETRLVLTNTIYFKSLWAEQFEEEDTTKAEFTSPVGKVVVDMMHMTEDFPLYKGEGFLALTLAYDGSAHALVVLLPDSHEIDDLAKLEGKLDAQAIRDILDESEGALVEVSFPRFKVESDISLKEVLQKFGMHDAFKLEKADFSRMTSVSELYIDEILHNAVIEVDEEGTKALAATDVTIGYGSMSPEWEEIVSFVADHPFTYMLIETDSKAIVFVGRYVGN